MVDSVSSGQQNSMQMRKQHPARDKLGLELMVTSIYLFMMWEDEAQSFSGDSHDQWVKEDSTDLKVCVEIQS
jgi:hypothetical protein